MIFAEVLIGFTGAIEGTDSLPWEDAADGGRWGRGESVSPILDAGDMGPSIGRSFLK